MSQRVKIQEHHVMMILIYPGHGCYDPSPDGREGHHTLEPLRSRPVTANPRRPSADMSRDEKVAYRKSRGWRRIVGNCWQSSNGLVASFA